MSQVYKSSINLFDGVFRELRNEILGCLIMFSLRNCTRFIKFLFIQPILYSGRQTHDCRYIPFPQVIFHVEWLDIRNSVFASTYHLPVDQRPTHARKSRSTPTEGLLEFWHVDFLCVAQH